MDDFDSLTCEEYYHEPVVNNEDLHTGIEEDDDDFPLFEEDDEEDEEGWEEYDTRLDDHNDFPYGIDVPDLTPEFDG